MMPISDLDKVILTLINTALLLDLTHLVTRVTVVVRQRQMELHEMKEYILDNKSSFSSTLRDIVDSSRIIAAGFSYGAATASLEVVTHPNDYTMCILLDGWFHIDVGDGFDFPKETHEKGMLSPRNRCFDTLLPLDLLFIHVT
jgi:hypothetical protein